MPFHKIFTQQVIRWNYVIFTQYLSKQICKFPETSDPLNLKTPTTTTTRPPPDTHTHTPFLLNFAFQWVPVVYSESSQTSNMENSSQMPKHCNLDVWQGSDYVYGCDHLISPRLREVSKNWPKKAKNAFLYNVQELHQSSDFLLPPSFLSVDYLLWKIFISSLLSSLILSV